MKPTVSPNGRSQRVVGLTLLIVGLLVNRWTLGMLLAPDGSLDGEARIRLVLLFDVFFVLAGVVLVWDRMRRWLGSVAPNVAAMLGLVALTSLTFVGTWWGITAYRGAHHHTMDMSMTEPPTAAQRKWAADFVARCWESARRHGWLNFEAAKADGFTLQWSDREHYVKREFVFDDKILDPDRPEFLMYEDTPKGKLLTGFMFFTRNLEEHGPQPAGSLANWHFHPWEGRGYCAEGALLPVSRPDTQGRCAEGVRVSRSAEMMHVWFIDHPLGPFADAMLLPDTSTAGVNATMFHPMLVHFAIALIFIAVVLDVLGRVVHKEQLHSAAFINLTFAAIFAVATIAAGMLAEVRLLIGHDVHQVLDTHKLFGFSACGGIVLLLIWRLTQRGRLPARGGLLYLAASILVAGLTGAAGYLGSELVYVNGLAVQAIDRQALERYERTVDSARAQGTPVDVVPAMHVHEH